MERFAVLVQTGQDTDITIKATRGIIKRVVIGKAGDASSTVVIYNGPVASSDEVSPIISAAAARVVDLDVECAAGIYAAVTDAGGTISVAFVYA